MALYKFTPSTQLRQYIVCYYLLEADCSEPTSDVFFPDGCIEVVFNVGLDFYRNNQKEYWAKVIGQYTHPLQIKATGNGKCFGIWFYPHTFSLFSLIPLHEITNKAVPLDTIFSAAILQFVAECLLINKVNHLLKGINIFLTDKINKVNRNLKDTVAEYAVQFISNHKDEINLDRLVRNCNISSGYLQKIFLEKVGISPTSLIRISRFNRALQNLNTVQKNTLTSLAYQSGYYDQPHFIREFKEFTGFSPSQYRLENHPINKYFLNS